MDQCTDIKIGRLLTQYEQVQLSEKDRIRVEEHLLVCDFCFNEVTEMMPLSDSIVENKEEITNQLQAEGLTFKEEKERLLGQTRRGAVITHRIDRIFDFVREFLQPKIYVPALVTAAALVFLLIIPQTSRKPDNPYQQFISFEKAPYRPVRAAQTTEAHDLFQRGMEAYQANNFKTAIANLNKATNLKPNEGKWWIYLGVSYHLDKQADLAIGSLQVADSLTTSTLKQRSRWYLAQAYLVSGDISNAVPLLEELVENKREYATEADELLMKIKTVTEKKIP